MKYFLTIYNYCNIRRQFLIVLLSLNINIAFGQTLVKLDSLTKVLEAVYKRDQVPRLRLDSLERQFGFSSIQVKKQWRLIEKNDSADIEVVTQILDTYGWLSESKTSKTANSALFSVIQHAKLNLQTKYIEILKEAVEKGNAKPIQYAYLLDRVNMREGKLQIYGSQLSVSSNGNQYFFPIKDEPNVNRRRKKIGLPPLQEVAFNSGFVYNLPVKDSLKNKLVVTGFVIEVDQAPISDVSIKFGTKVVAKTNADGFYKAIISKDFLKEQLAFEKEGYILSEPPLDNQDKEVYELMVMLTKK